MKTLDLINAAREAFALPPLARLPKGEINRIRSCPVANALKEICPDVGVYADEVKFDSAATAMEVGRLWGEAVDGRIVILPKTIKQFVKKFDDGHYPKYEE